MSGMNEKQTRVLIWHEAELFRKSEGFHKLPYIGLYFECGSHNRRLCYETIFPKDKKDFYGRPIGPKYCPVTLYYSVKKSKWCIGKDFSDESVLYESQTTAGFQPPCVFKGRDITKNSNITLIVELLQDKDDYTATDGNERPGRSSDYFEDNRRIKVENDFEKEVASLKKMNDEKDNRIARLEKMIADKFLENTPESAAAKKPRTSQNA